MPIAVKSFFHQQSATFTYLVSCLDTHSAILIDPPADFDAPSATLTFTTANQIIDYITTHKITLEWVLETHAHADHITAASYIKQQLKDKHPCKLGTGAGIMQVQAYFSHLYQLDMPPDGSPFNTLFNDGDRFSLGNTHFDVITTPGHTPDSVSYLIDENLFVGDTFFMPDSGTARCDFPGGSAKELFASLHKLLALPDKTIMWMCHDYQPYGRELANKTTVQAQRLTNVHLQQSEHAYIDTREKRDATLSAPQLLHPAIQMNIRAGQLPLHTHSFLTIPLTVLL